MKRAFIGHSTPIAYDYSTENRDGHVQPNPILESVVGLLICYDELWFAERKVCPLDMQDLPYVHFADEEAGFRDRVSVATEQFSYPMEQIPITVNRSVTRLVADRIRSCVKFDMVMDLHNRSHGNVAEESAFTIDIGVASAIDMDMDVIVNTPLADALGRVYDGQEAAQYDYRQVLATEEITSIRTIDHLGPRGAYHPSLEELRSHRRVSEFREFLASQTAPDQDAKRLAVEVNRLADKHTRDVMERFLAGNGKIETIGSAGMGFLGNAVAPGLGSGLSVLYNTSKWIREKAHRKEVAWSLFILDARRLR